MSATLAEQRAEWIGVSIAAEILSTSCYSVKTAALDGAIRTRRIFPGRTLFARADVERLAESFNPPTGVRVAQLA